MSIKIDITELRRIVSRSETVNTEISSALTKINTELDSICKNVKSTELTQATTNLTNIIGSISTKVDASLPKINQFLSNQLSNYENVNTQTKQIINELINEINTQLS